MRHLVKASSPTMTRGKKFYRSCREARRNGTGCTVLRTLWLRRKKKGAPQKPPVTFLRGTIVGYLVAGDWRKLGRMVSFPPIKTVVGSDTDAITAGKLWIANTRISRLVLM